MHSPSDVSDPEQLMPSTIVELGPLPKYPDVYISGDLQAKYFVSFNMKIYICGVQSVAT